MIELWTAVSLALRLAWGVPAPKCQQPQPAWCDGFCACPAPQQRRHGGHNGGGKRRPGRTK